MPDRPADDRARRRCCPARGHRGAAAGLARPTSWSSAIPSPSGRSAPADVDPLAALQEASILRLGTATYGAAKVRAWARIGHEFKHVLLEEGRYFVAERAGERVGVGGWSPDSLEADLAWIRYLFVHPDHVRLRDRPRSGRGRGACGRRRGSVALRGLVEPQCRALLRRARLSPVAGSKMAGRGRDRARLCADGQARRPARDRRRVARRPLVAGLSR